MKPVNINSLLQAKKSLDAATLDTYLSYNGIEIKAAEFKDLENFTQTMLKAGANPRDLDDFYVSYRIPQIGKEFDLLRFGQDSIVNIELKSDSTPEKIKAQLQRNNYYLSFLGRNIHAFAYVSMSGKLHLLNSKGKLEIADPAHLLELLRSQAPATSQAPDLLFNPSNYLVSPFNSTDKFLVGEYFLTHQQEEIKSKILSSIESALGAAFISVTGSAGTGKTLLTFDVAKHLYESGRKVLLIHCGQLNSGHHTLAKHGWKITSIKNYKAHELKHIDAVIIDEAQRIYKAQLDDLVAQVNQAKCTCIFSYDKVQTLSNWEEKSDISGKIDALASAGIYKLSEKIRTNKEIARFIKLLFNNKATTSPQSTPNIKINYFSSTEDAKAYLNGLGEEEWEVLRFTPSQYNNEHHEKYFDAWSKTSHQVIGQEFDSVAIAVDQFFAYDEDGDLTYQGSVYYAPTKMLFQNITRARRRLNLVIIANQHILKRCLAILK